MLMAYDGSYLILKRTDNVVRIGEDGNKSLLGKITGSINENDSLHLPKVCHQVLYIRGIGNIERLNVIRNSYILVFLKVCLAPETDRLLDVTVNNKNLLPVGYQIIGK